MRRLVWAAAGGVLLLGAIGACVGDQPGVSSSDAGADAAVDATTSDTSAPDTSAAETSTPDAGADASRAADADAAADAGSQLPDVGAGHLQLWLTADRGVTCTNGQITTWADQSGKGHDATSGSHLGPQCPATGHALNGVSLPYFSSPGAAPYTDETLDVNLSFLRNTDFTIFVVERRWKDRPLGGQAAECLVGTDPLSACDETIYFGYVYYDGNPALDFDPQCGGERAQMPDASALPPSPTVLDMVRLRDGGVEAGASHTIWQNGVLVASNGTHGRFTHDSTGGAIGRWGNDSTVDTRFQGDIAEIVVFDTGLSDVEKQQMEAYFKARWNLP